MANTGGRRDDWRTTATGGGGRRPTPGGGGKRRWVVAAFVVALLVGLLVSWPLFTRPPVDPIVLALPVSEYYQFRDSPWPPNPWAEADARGLRDRFGGDSAQAFQHQEKSALVRELANAVRRADEQRQPLVVYLTALGTAVGETPYLLPTDARPDAPASWLTLDDVLDPVRRGTTDRLVILDVRPVRTPLAALPTADVNELIDAALAAKHSANDLPLLVFTANTPAAGPLAIPSYRHTAFGLALDRGISGAADGWLPGSPKNTEVSARELAEYAREVTHTITGGAQRPQLYGHADDFRLVAVPTNPLAPADPEPLAYPQFLTDAWADLDAARKDGLPARAPRAVRQQSDAAVDAERWWLAGADPAAIQTRYAVTFDPFRQALKSNTLALPRPPVASVARARAESADFDTQAKMATDALRGVLALLKSDAYTVARKAEPPKAQMMLEMELGKLKLPPEVPYPAVVAAVWRAARDRPDVEFVRSLLAVVDGLPPPPTPLPPLAELATLRLIASAPDKRSNKRPADAVRVWLDAAEAAETAAVMDGRALPPVRAMLAAADVQYRRAVVALTDPTAPIAGLEPAVADLRAARDAYAEVSTATAALGQAWRQVESTRAALADLADRSPRELVRLPGREESSLADLTEAYLAVAEQVRQVPFGNADELKRKADTLRSRRELRFALIVPPAGDDPRLLESALDWPGWTAGERTSLVARFREATAAVVGRLPTASTGRELPPSPPSSPTPFEESRFALRNRIAQIRAWDPKQADLLAARLPASPPPAGEWLNLITDVTAAVRGEARKRFDDNPAERAFLGWVIPPAELAAVPPTDPAANPELTARRRAEQDLRRSLASDRYSELAAAVAGFAKPASGEYSAVASELSR